MQQCIYYPRQDNHAFSTVGLYVTNDSTTAPGNWGTAALNTTFPYVNTSTSVYLVGTGRYFIIYGQKYQSGPTVKELRLFGVKVDPTVTAFTATGSTGQTGFTADPTVSISITASAPDGDIAGYMVTQSATPPAVDDANWSATVPPTYTISGDPGAYTLYAWVKGPEPNNCISGKAQPIFYDTATPVISDIQIFGTTPTLAMATWATDIPTVGRVRYNDGTEMATAWETTPATQHWRPFPVTLGTSYTVIIDSGAASSSEQTYEHLSPATDTAARISKTGMVADGSVKGNEGLWANGIDGNPGSDWRATDQADTWYRVNMGARHRLQMFGYKPPVRRPRLQHLPDLHHRRPVDQQGRLGRSGHRR